MSDRDRLSEPPSPPGRLGDADDETMLALAAFTVATAFVGSRLVGQAPLLAVGGVAVVAAGVLVGVWARARVRDGRARRTDPQGPGVVIGSVRGAWRFARRRPFVLPWPSFVQHVLICGPTGRGKTFTFIEPVLRAHIDRPDTGVFYLDGKGDRIDLADGDTPGVAFDHVFCPADPKASACWNPLAGPDPVRAAGDFAAALYPDASGSGANFYEARAVFAITRVAPAMALTGHGLGDDPAGRADEASDPDEVVAALQEAGVDGARAGDLVRRWGPERCRRQLAWLPYRSPGADVVELVRRDARPSATTPLGLLAGAGGDVTPAALSRVLFGTGGLERLGDALRAAQSAAPPIARVQSVLEQLRHDIGVLQALPAKERAAMLANLHNRLGLFLQPPFLTLCSRSDMRVAEVTDGRHVAFLLSTGAFPEVAQALGRVALAQFRNAVLAGHGPGVRKIAVLDEFHNFVDASFGAFLAQARSSGGGAVMALQSLAQLAHGPAGRELLDEMLANLSTVIVTPGCRPFDAAYFADLFGQAERIEASWSYEAPGPLAVRSRPQLRLERREAYRFTPTQISELPAGQALVQLTDRRTAYAATVVDVERG